MFRSIVGHRRLVTLLSRAVAHDTLPPSLIFAGPAGVGKRRTAVAVAQALNCLAPVSPGEENGVAIERDACGVCAACRRIARGVHPDVMVLEPGELGNIRIEAVREAVESAGYRPFEARRRVVVIDEADAMVPQAQNALLKTLEEPPSSSVFVLVSSLADALLPTVQSRCPKLRFAALSTADVAFVLVRDHGYEEADARAAALEGNGSVARALASQSSSLVDARTAAQRILARAAKSTDPGRRLDALKELPGGKGGPAEERERLSVCLRAMASLLRDLSILSAGADERTLANPDLRGELERLTSAFDASRSGKAYAVVDEALVALDRNASPKIVADWVVVKL
jgi:DNA polymerase-3 subunit delta'